MPKNTKVNAFVNERKQFVKKMLTVLGYKKENTRIVFNQLMLDNTIEDKLKELHHSYKRYFYTSNIKDDPDDRNYLLSMFKNVLKEMNYKVFTTETKIKIGDKHKTTTVYNILPPTAKLLF